LSVIATWHWLSGGGRRSMSYSGNNADLTKDVSAEPYKIDGRIIFDLIHSIVCNISSINLLSGRHHRRNVGKSELQYVVIYTFSSGLD
jgi:hypothetical protein